TARMSTRHRFAHRMQRPPGACVIQSGIRIPLQGNSMFRFPAAIASAVFTLTPAPATASLPGPVFAGLVAAASADIATPGARARGGSDPARRRVGDDQDPALEVAGSLALCPISLFAVACVLAFAGAARYFC